MSVSTTIVSVRVESKAVYLLHHHVMNGCWTRGGKDLCTVGHHLFADIPCFISWIGELFGLLLVGCVFVNFLHTCIITWK
jgi:hypothetical protein